MASDAANQADEGYTATSSTTSTHQPVSAVDPDGHDQADQNISVTNPSDLTIDNLGPGDTPALQPTEASHPADEENSQHAGADTHATPGQENAGTNEPAQIADLAVTLPLSPFPLASQCPSSQEESNAAHQVDDEWDNDSAIGTDQG